MSNAQGGLPIFCFHLGDALYVRLVIAQARAWNPDSPIHLITDQPAENYPEAIVHPVMNFAARAVEFAKIYLHRSQNELNLELACLHRWLILSELMKTLPYERCFVMDSDVLLYGNITQEHSKYREFKFTLTHQMSAGECYFDVDVIHHMADCIFEAYKTRNTFYWAMTQARYEWILEAGETGGVSDMLFFSLLTGSYAGRWLDSMHIIQNASFDHHVNTEAPGFEMEEGRKKIIWKANQPYGILTTDKREVRFISLHFQGNAKFDMVQYARGPIEGSIW